jgi:membrane protease YdiL (CAAX protease family)
MDQEINFKKRILPILTFYIIALALRYYFVVYNPAFYENMPSGFVKILLRGIGPIVGASIVIIAFNRSFALSLFGNSKRKSIIMAVIPILLFALSDIILKNYSFSMTFSVITFFCYAMLEEFGWRGYLQGELSQMKKFFRILLIAVLWFIWHLNFTVSLGNLVFFLILVLGSWGIGKIAIKTNSLVACACFHSVINILGAHLPLVSLSTKILLLSISIILWFLLWFNQRIAKLIA